MYIDMKWGGRAEKKKIRSFFFIFQTGKSKQEGVMGGVMYTYI